MSYHRNRYCRFLNGIVALQELFRVRKLKIQNEIRKSNLKRPFRFRIHDIHLLFSKQSKFYSSVSNSDDKIVPSKPTEMSNNKKSFNPSTIGINKPKSYTVNVPPTSNVVLVGETTTLVYDNVFGCGHRSNVFIRDRDKEMMEILAQGTKDISAYCKINFCCDFFIVIAITFYIIVVCTK